MAYLCSDYWKKYSQKFKINLNFIFAVVAGYYFANVLET